MSEEKKEDTVEEQNKETTAIEKKEEKPKPKEYTKEEIEEIARKVESPSDQTPTYKPVNVLSPEYEGTSNYEIGLRTVRKDLEEKLARLKNNPDANSLELKQTEEDLKTIDYLYENYHLGMNVFRTAKGGRAKLRE